MSRLHTLFRTHPNTLILTTTLFTTSLTLTYFIDTHILTLSRIHGPSMSPTLSPHHTSTGTSDWVLLQKYTLSPSLLPFLNPLSSRHQPSPLPHSRAHLKRGDIIAYGKAHDPNGAAVKRILALGGDKIIRHSDPRRRAREAVEARKLGLVAVNDELIVPRNHIWVESDNPHISTLDSNVFGPVPVNLVLGRVSRIVWPLDRRGDIPARPRRVDWQETRVVEGFVRFVEQKD
jgi:mitochondrial inner membrane protease subunit 2